MQATRASQRRVAVVCVVAVAPRVFSLLFPLLATGHDLNTVTKFKDRVHMLIIS